MLLTSALAASSGYFLSSQSIHFQCQEKSISGNTISSTEDIAVKHENISCDQSYLMHSVGGKIELLLMHEQDCQDIHDVQIRDKPRNHILKEPPATIIEQ